MKHYALGLAAVCTLVLASMLAASPAEAICFGCTCESSCDEICFTGPDIPDCPECNVSTCGVSGICVGDPSCSPPPGGSCNNLTCTTTINGGSSGDTLNGTAARECINGLGGNDTLSGNSGDDRISGGNGNDTLYGDSGNDCLWGDDGADHLDGGTGTDFGDGGTGTDTCTNLESSVNCP